MPSTKKTSEDQRDGVGGTEMPSDGQTGEKDEARTSPPPAVIRVAPERRNSVEVVPDPHRVQLSVVHMSTIETDALVKAEALRARVAARTARAHTLANLRAESNRHVTPEERFKAFNVGHVELQRASLDAELAHLAEQMGRLKAHLEHVPPGDERLLQVFMAPEFFFKYKHGEPYSRSAFFEAQKQLGDLSAMFPKVVIVPGTIWWHEPIVPGSELYEAIRAEKGAMQDGVVVSDEQWIVHNSANVFFGGKIACTWQKNRVSPIDGFLPADESFGSKTDKWREYVTDPHKLSPIFQIDLGGRSLRFGIEVCLDHAPDPRGVLRSRVGPSDAPPPEDSLLDVHLLTAAGMKAKGQEIPVRVGGLFFWVDGSYVESTAARVSRPLAHKGYFWNANLDRKTPLVQIDPPPPDPLPATYVASRTIIYPPLALPPA